MPNVKLHNNGKITEHKVDEGKNILEFLREQLVEIPTPCGGRGTCGKCRIKVIGNLRKPSAKEKTLLGTASLESGYRLACYNKIESDIEISIDSSKNNANIVTTGLGELIKGKPAVTKKYIEIQEPSITDQRDDVDRILDVSGDHYSLPHRSQSSYSYKLSSLGLVRQIPEMIRKNGYKVTVIIRENAGVKEISGIEPNNTENELYGIAIDIGTTTIAAYLFDLNEGKQVDVYSILNPQKKFGADILSRIDYANGSLEAQNELHKEIKDCINSIIEAFCKNNGIENNLIYTIVFVGNTTMMHFLMDISAKNIALSPFIPVTTNSYRLNPEELGIKINVAGILTLFPSVSSYIGADTIAAVISTEMHRKDEISLLVDIGTNGEIVLGNKEQLYACSTAAGPAFEGANIRNGVGGISGAIDRVYFRDRLHYTTIDDEKAIGICGSGIVDAIAGMLDKEIMDETGRIVDLEEYLEISKDHNNDNDNDNDNSNGNGNGNDDDSDYKGRFLNVDGLSSFLLVSSKDSNSGDDIVITQRDVRELQNAKAAIAAGIKILLKEAGICAEQVSKVYLAGGFGNYINIESGRKIGLIPSEFETKKIKSVGNAAGIGAVKGLLSTESTEDAYNVKNKIKYIELSTSKDFVDEYVNCMFF